MLDLIDWIRTHIPGWVYITLVVHLAVLGVVAYLILLERKIASWVQDRIGPNRVGLGFGIIPWLKDKHMFGLGQPLADGLKFIFKEDYQPKGVDRILFTVAPMMMIIVIIVSIAVIPWGGVLRSSTTVDVTSALPTDANGDIIASALNNALKPNTPEHAMVVRETSNQIAAGSTLVSDPHVWADMSGKPRVLADVTYQWPFQIASLNIGVLFVLAVLSLAVYGVVIGGWASNNKYSFLGGLRATANMISYEIPLGLAVLSIVVLFGSLDLGVIVNKQAGYWLGVIPAWNVFSNPLAFVLFLTCIHAEANRAPFDTAEAEQELVGGYHTEYSSMRFALFFLAEYAGMITTSAVCVALFFGGWHLPWVEWLWPGLRGDAAGGNPAVTTSLIACIVRSMVFFGKTLAIVAVFMWVRWSLPRFRFDQIMMLAWRAMIPISLGLLMVTSLVVWWWHGASHAALPIPLPMALALLVVNVGLLVVAMAVSLVIPAAPATNRRIRVPGSRYNRPAGAAANLPAVAAS